jgi:hypothetical protein
VVAILCQRVFTSLNHLLCNLLPQFNRIERLVLGQAAEDS